MIDPEIWRLLVQASGGRLKRPGRPIFAGVRRPVVPGRPPDSPKGITVADLRAVEEKFSTIPQNYNKAVFWQNRGLGRWEVYEDSRLDDLIAHDEDNWS